MRVRDGGSASKGGGCGGARGVAVKEGSLPPPGERRLCRRAYAVTQGLRGALRACRLQLEGPRLLGEAPGARWVWRGAGEPGGGGGEAVRLRGTRVERLWEEEPAASGGARGQRFRASLRRSPSPQPSQRFLSRRVKAKSCRTFCGKHATLSPAGRHRLPFDAWARFQVSKQNPGFLGCLVCTSKPDVM